MYIINESGMRIFWRVFNRNDDAKWVGVGEGILEPKAPNNFTSWWNGKAPDTKVQLTVKIAKTAGKSDWKMLEKASKEKLYGMDDEVVITSSGVQVLRHDVTP